MKFKSTRNFWKPATLLGMVLTMFLLLSSIESQATHFRTGTISWTEVSPGVVEFDIQQGWRRSFFGSPNVGDVISPGSFIFGDGNATSISLTVTSVDFAEDWVFGTFSTTHTYSSTGNYTAYWNGCCRISTLENAPDASYRVETIVNVGAGNVPPVSSISPVVNVVNGLTNAAIPVPASDPNGDPLTWRFSTSAENGMPASANPPAGMTINSTTGVINWNTVGLTAGNQYAVAVAIEDGLTKTMIDFVVEIVEAGTNTAPAFHSHHMPTAGSVLVYDIGDNISLSFGAEDVNTSQTVTLNGTGFPVGAVLTPSLPTGGNPVHTDFTWTPQLGDEGSYLINLTATDDQGAQVSYSFTIVVDPPPVPTLGQWGLIIFGLLLLCSGAIFVWRRQYGIEPNTAKAS